MPMPRKPLEADCTGSVDCPVEGHVQTATFFNGTTRTKHISLTQGQRRTLYERRRGTATQ